MDGIELIPVAEEGIVIVRNADRIEFRPTKLVGWVVIIAETHALELPEERRNIPLEGEEEFGKFPDLFPRLRL